MATLASSPADRSAQVDAPSRATLARCTWSRQPVPSPRSGPDPDSRRSLSRSASCRSTTAAATTSDWPGPAAYLAKIPPAVAGQRGHDRTFHAACILIQGFDLTIDEARPLLHQWNLGCVPPWSPAELEHKLHDALRAGDSRPRGYLWDRGSRTRRRTVRRDRPHGSNGHGSGHPPSHLERLLLLPHHLRNRDHCPDGQEANPHRLAQQFLTTGFAFAGGIGLRYWRDEFHSWDGTAYHAFPEVKCARRSRA